MDYKDNIRPDVDTPKIILKVNHAGEYGAISIYRAQILFSKLFYKDLTPVLEEFLNDEKRHLDIFWNEIQARDGIKCKSVYLCGAGGFAMGAISSLLGRKGIMACTWAVESVVIKHLTDQLVYLKEKNDVAAYSAVNAILQDEINHRDVGQSGGGVDNIWYAPLRFMISTFTEGVIRIGMR